MDRSRLSRDFSNSFFLHFLDPAGLFRVTPFEKLKKKRFDLRQQNFLQILAHGGTLALVLLKAHTSTDSVRLLHFYCNVALSGA